MKVVTVSASSLPWCSGHLCLLASSRGSFFLRFCFSPHTISQEVSQGQLANELLEKFSGKETSGRKQARRRGWKRSSSNINGTTGLPPDTGQESCRGEPEDRSSTRSNKTPIREANATIGGPNGIFQLHVDIFDRSDLPVGLSLLSS